MAERYAVVDAIRGFALLNMVCYHFIWNLVYLYGFDWQWFLNMPGELWQQAICIIFIFVSGFSQAWSQNPLYRGCVISLWGLALTIITMVLMPQLLIVYGVLTCIGTCMLFFALAAPLLEHLKQHAAELFIVSLVLFICTHGLIEGYIGIGTFSLQLPESWYANWLTTFVGLPAPTFYSADYFPLLPWLFLFTAGWGLHQIMEQKNMLQFLKSGTMTYLEWMGRYSLWIYLAHQPIIFILLRMVL